MTLASIQRRLEEREKMHREVEEEWNRLTRIGRKAQNTALVRWWAF